MTSTESYYAIGVLSNDAQDDWLFSWGDNPAVATPTPEPTPTPTATKTPTQKETPSDGGGVGFGIVGALLAMGAGRRLRPSS